MNLLSLLMGSMTTNDSVNALSQKTGASSKQVGMLISLALPLLIKYMTSNASSSQGASSLLGALTHHNSKKTMSQQIMQADEEDGKKIVNHILGNQSQSVVNDLAGQTGLSSDQVSQLLGSLAPSMMSGLSAATQSNAQQSPSGGMDLSGLMGMFGGMQQSQGGSGLGLLGSLLGGAAPADDKKDDNLNGTALLNLLMSAGK